MCLGIRPFTRAGQATWGKLTHQQPLAANCPSVGARRVLWAPRQIHVGILTVLIFLGFHACSRRCCEFMCSVGLSSQENCPSAALATSSSSEHMGLLWSAVCFFPPKLTSWEGPAEELRGRRGSQNEALLPEQRHSVLCANKLMKLCFTSAVSMSVTFKIRHLFFKGKLKCLSVSRSRIQKASQAISSFNTEWDSVPEVCSDICWFHKAYFLVKTGFV